MEYLKCKSISHQKPMQHYTGVKEALILKIFFYPLVFQSSELVKL